MSHKRHKMMSYACITRYLMLLLHLTSVCWASNSYYYRQSSYRTERTQRQSLPRLRTYSRSSFARLCNQGSSRGISVGKSRDGQNCYYFCPTNGQFEDPRITRPYYHCCPDNFWMDLQTRVCVRHPKKRHRPQINGFRSNRNQLDESLQNQYQDQVRRIKELSRETFERRCPEGPTKDHPTDLTCRKYLRCVYNQYFELTCPFGFRWNPTLKICDPSYQCVPSRSKVNSEEIPSKVNRPRVPVAKCMNNRWQRKFFRKTHGNECPEEHGYRASGSTVYGVKRPPSKGYPLYSTKGESGSSSLGTKRRFWEKKKTTKGGSGGKTGSNHNNNFHSKKGGGKVGSLPKRRFWDKSKDDSKSKGLKGITRNPVITTTSAPTIITTNKPESSSSSTSVATAQPEVEIETATTTTTPQRLRPPPSTTTSTLLPEVELTTATPTFTTTTTTTESSEPEVDEEPEIDKEEEETLPVVSTTTTTTSSIRTTITALPTTTTTTTESPEPEVNKPPVEMELINQTTIVTTTTTTTTQGPMIMEEGSQCYEPSSRFKDPEDCQCFYECHIDLKLARNCCPEGLFFNQLDYIPSVNVTSSEEETSEMMAFCDLDENVQCKTIIQ